MHTIRDNQWRIESIQNKNNSPRKECKMYILSDCWQTLNMYTHCLHHDSCVSLNSCSLLRCKAAKLWQRYVRGRNQWSRAHTLGDHTRLHHKGNLAYIIGYVSVTEGRWASMQQNWTHHKSGRRMRISLGVLHMLKIIWSRYLKAWLRVRKYASNWSRNVLEDATAL